MFPTIVRRGLAAFSSLAIAGTVAVALPMTADAAASRAYGGSAYGSSARFGDVISLGRTANQPFCTTASNTSRSNNTAEVTNLEGLGTLGVQVTKTQSVKSGTTQSSITTSETAATNLLKGLVTFDAIKAKATVSLVSNTYQEKGETTFVGLKVAGVLVQDQSPAPNTTIELPLGGGRIILNQQGTLNNSGNHSQGVNGLRLTLDSDNDFGLPAGDLVISYSLASLHSPTFRRAYGVAYTTKVQLGDVIKSGATAAVNLPCGGSSGVTRSNNIAGVNLSQFSTVGAASTSARSTDDATSTTARTAAQVLNVNLLNGLVTADAVKAVSNTTKKGTTYTRSSTGSTFVNLKIDGTPVTVGGSNTTIPITGVGTLFARRATLTSTGLEVTALELVLSSDQGDLLAGTKITIGFAQSGVA